MFDILIITKANLDDTLTHSLKQTVIQCRIDLIEIGNGGRVIIYVRKDIPSKFLRKHLFPNGIEEIFVEINFSKSKLQLCSTYNPPSQSDQYYVDNIGKALDIYCQYGKVVLVENLTAQIEERCFDEFLFQHQPEIVNDKPTSYKNRDKLVALILF